jgi:hypothetical protein
VAQFCYFSIKNLEFVSLPGTLLANPLQLRNKEQRNGSIDVDRRLAYIPFQNNLSVVLKTRPNKFAFYASFTFVCIRACVTVNIYKIRVLIFIHNIFIISILRTPWIVYQGCTEGSVYKFLRSSATFVEVMCSIPRCVLWTRL